jgi:hypothetical protein
MARSAAVPTAVSAAPSPADQASAVPFPPRDIAAFLACCAGEWLALRSCFQLELPPEPEDEHWHTSGRAELRIAYLEPIGPDDPGGLAVQPPHGPSRELRFQHGPNDPASSPGSSPGSSEGSTGTFHSGADQGEWQLWPDGSLDLRIGTGQGQRLERIWFTKPNLRLRSCIEQGAEGQPARASFSSEIRRLPRPAAETD